ncbi:cytochrome C assembly protein [gamma proteobacterium HdN1]|nr:cytochrome C assembly protein [gamma proteobacterium HdN1]
MDLMITSAVHLSALIACLGYTFLTYALVQMLRGKPLIAMSTMRILGAATLLVHGINIHQQVFRPDGVQLGVVAAAALFAFVATCTATIMSWFHRMDALVAPTWLLGAIAIGFSTFGSDSTPPVTHLSSGMIAHIVLSITANTLITLAGSQAVLLYLQNRYLKNRGLLPLLRLLPPLQTMETMLFDLVAAGCLMLTISMITGFLYVDDLFAQHLVHKTVLTIASWVVLETLLLGRWLWGWRGQTAVRWTLGGFVLLILAYFGSAIVLQMIIQH